MKYQDIPAYSSRIPGTLGVLFVNLGTPVAPTPREVRRYLAEFLFDPRVVELPRPLWWLVLHGVILRLRPRRSAKLYQKIWTAAGSPLLEISRRQVAALQQGLDRVRPGQIRVCLAMRYGSPSIAEGLAELRRVNAQRVLVLPLYPQYSATTTASTFDAIARVLMRQRWLPELRFINQYHDDPGYIRVLADSVRDHWRERGEAERLLMSFHGIPQEYADAGDPYADQCRRSAHLLAEALGLSNERWQLAFQSRLGPKQWLQPYTDQTLQRWGQEGRSGRVDVICPGFPADCLETLEEIAEQNRELFLHAGGRDYGFIPGLNASPGHIGFLLELVERHLQGWLERP